MMYGGATEDVFFIYKYLKNTANCSGTKENKKKIKPTEQKWMKKSSSIKSTIKKIKCHSHVWKKNISFWLRQATRKTIKEIYKELLVQSKFSVLKVHLVLQGGCATHTHTNSKKKTLILPHYCYLKQTLTLIIPWDLCNLFGSNFHKLRRIIDIWVCD